jgi:hypothetical protein
MVQAARISSTEAGEAGISVVEPLAMLPAVLVGSTELVGAISIHTAVIFVMAPTTRAGSTDWEEADISVMAGVEAISLHPAAILVMDPVVLVGSTDPDQADVSVTPSVVATSIGLAVIRVVRVGSTAGVAEKLLGPAGISVMALAVVQAASTNRIDQVLSAVTVQAVPGTTVPRFLGRGLIPLLLLFPVRHII